MYLLNPQFYLQYAPSNSPFFLLNWKAQVRFYHHSLNHWSNSGALKMFNSVSFYQLICCKQFLRLNKIKWNVRMSYVHLDFSVII